MKVKDLSGWTRDALEEDIRNGGRFVVYTYVISYIVMTEKKPSDVFYLRPGDSAFGHGIKYFLISILFGWWGIPWGPIYTIQAIYYAFTGVDVTYKVKNDVLQSLVSSPRANAVATQTSQIASNSPYHQPPTQKYSNAYKSKEQSSIIGAKICPKCNTPNNKGGEFCTSCGTRLT